MALYKLKNISKNGHVFVGLRGVQTLKPGQEKTVDLSDSDRYGPEVSGVEGDHLEVTPVKAGEAKKAEPKAPDEPPKKTDEPPKK